MMVIVKRLTLLTTMILGACDGGAIGSDASQAATHSSLSSSSSASVSSSPDQNCSAPADLSLTNIESVVTWINAMPKPLSLACFVKSIPRPIYYNATLSTFSAQPSVGRRSPRVFFQIGDLLLTLVPDEITEDVKNPETGKYERVWDADGIQLLELSEKIPSIDNSDISIKGEIAFPVTEPLARNAAFAHINFTATNSVCSICHAHEREEGVLDGQPYYSSRMLRNIRDAEVYLAPMINEYATCDPTLSPSAEYRCEMLEAIYGQGVLVWRSFPLSMPTF